jgi:hypothetical protein
MKIREVSAMVWDQPDGGKAVVRVELSEALGLLRTENVSEREAARKKIQKRIEQALRNFDF